MRPFILLAALLLLCLPARADDAQPLYVKLSWDVNTGVGGSMEDITAACKKLEKLGLFGGVNAFPMEDGSYIYSLDIAGFYPEVTDSAQTSFDTQTEAQQFKDKLISAGFENASYTCFINTTLSPMHWLQSKFEDGSLPVTVPPDFPRSLLYTVYVCGAADNAAAEAIAAELRDQGIAAAVAQHDFAWGSYVRCGSFASESEAQVQLQSLRSLGYRFSLISAGLPVDESFRYNAENSRKLRAMGTDHYERWHEVPTNGLARSQADHLSELIGFDLSARFPYSVFEVYCGPYGTETEAQVAAEKLLLAGYNAVATEVSGQPNCVFVDGLPAVDDADNLKAELVVLGYPADIMGNSYRNAGDPEQWLNPAN